MRGGMNPASGISEQESSRKNERQMPSHRSAERPEQQGDELPGYSFQEPADVTDVGPEWISNSQNPEDSGLSSDVVASLMRDSESITTPWQMQMGIRENAPQVQLVQEAQRPTTEQFSSQEPYSVLRGAAPHTAAMPTSMPSQLAEGTLHEHPQAIPQRTLGSVHDPHQQQQSTELYQGAHPISRQNQESTHKATESTMESSTLQRSQSQQIQYLQHGAVAAYPAQAQLTSPQLSLISSSLILPVPPEGSSHQAGPLRPAGSLPQDTHLHQVRPLPQTVASLQGPLSGHGAPSHPAVLSHQLEPSYPVHSSHHHHSAALPTGIYPPYIATVPLMPNVELGIADAHHPARAEDSKDLNKYVRSAADIAEAAKISYRMLLKDKQKKQEEEAEKEGYPMSAKDKERERSRRESAVTRKRSEIYILELEKTARRVPALEHNIEILRAQIARQRHEINQLRGSPVAEASSYEQNCVQGQAGSPGSTNTSRVISQVERLDL